MRLFITKQNCNRGGRVSGSIPDDSAEELDAQEWGDYSELARDIEADCGLSASILDCDSWDGTREELIEEFEGEIKYLKAKGVHNSNDLFRLNRAESAIKWLKERGENA